MMWILLATALLFAPPAADSEVFSVGALTGANELEELREAVLQDGLPVSVRRASLDRYTELVRSGEAETKVEEIASNIRAFVEPAADAGFEVTVESAGELRVAGTADQLRWVESFLEAASDEGFLDSFVDVKLEIYRLPMGQTEGLTAGLTMNAEELAALKAKLAKIDGMALVTAPRVITDVGARANMTLVEETAYIKDFELTFFPDREQAIADPVVGVVHEGLFIDLRALPVARGTLMLKADIRTASLKRPIREETRKAVPGGGADLTVQVPEVREVKAAVQFEVKEGTSVVLSTVDPGFEGEAEQELLMVITAVLTKDE
ncbi:hypothetical protein Poly30_10880 [Planctomycetes bacterium Poly30]|uniref:Bacterial type II and III secretion system protein n=1 Tax=Saltatorellus ferox TaxID=2528018 RepID=A0A518END0_9BACT|nr:hypothetical protein Poly30_10880 [Planctomycetes bacterium Poly30]